jgi:hypothetical protein
MCFTRVSGEHIFSSITSIIADLSVNFTVVSQPCIFLKYSANIWITEAAVLPDIVVALILSKQYRSKKIYQE